MKNGHWMAEGENLSGNNAVELYNLTSDLEERNNLAQIEIAKRDELLEELLRWIDDVEAPVPSERNAEYNEIYQNTYN
jgi:hypothetical protein